MWLWEMLQRRGGLVYSAARVASAVGMSTLLVLMLIIVADVFLRKAFNQPIPGTYELTEYMLIVVCFCSVAWTQVKKRHVAVDLVIKRLPQRVQTNVKGVAYLIGFGLFCVATYTAFVRAKAVASYGLESLVLGVPRFPFQLIVGIGLGMLSLVLLVDFLHFLAESRRI